MLKFLLRRFANYLVLVALATCLGYFLAATSLNPRSNYEGRNPRPSQASIEAKLNELNLNNHTPIVKRFTKWAGNFVHGDMGKTFQERPVWDEMKRRMGVSLRLLFIGSVLGAALGVGLGVIGAVKQYSLTDHLSTAWAFVLLSTPVFVLALMLKLGAARYWNPHMPPATRLYYVGEYTPKLGGSTWLQIRDRLAHLVLPTLGIVLGQVAFYSRYQRNSFLDVMGSDFLRTAQAKGLRRRTALIKHGLRTALIPMATFFAYSFGLLLTGATFTEKIFGWHGMGEWFIDSISNNDVNVVAAVIVFSAVLILIAGLIADLLYAALDPRVRIR
ncbi:MAG: glutathione transport system permease protein [Actinomycetota bacterium]|jgi:peptide/nickel transport system permease protein|nr:glutathione transport system permease protein [Actinomycetota bacterium]